MDRRSLMKLAAAAAVSPMLPAVVVGPELLSIMPMGEWRMGLIPYGSSLVVGQVRHVGQSMYSVSFFPSDRAA